MSISRSCRLFPPFLCASLIATVGCGPRALETQGDPVSAQETLQHVLDHWKLGSTPADLTAETPAIYANDEDWQAGRQLKSFEILDETIQNGTSWRIYATLTLAGKGAPSRPQKVCYLVEMGEPTAVSRSDSLY